MATQSHTTLIAHLIKSGYRPIPCMGKRPIHAQWPTKQVPPSQWKSDWNIGILCGEGVYGADFDFYDDKVSVEIQQSFIDRFGYPPIREGQYPKALMVYRGSPGQKKLRRAWKAPDGTVHAFELLGAGQQFIAFGIHPDTHKNYTWDDDEFTIKELETWELPKLDFDEVSNWMENISVPDDWVETTRLSDLTPGLSPQKGTDAIGDLGDFDGLIDSNVHRKKDQKEIEQLLKVLDPNMENDEWIRVGMALRNWDEEEGLAVWEKWSKAGDTWQEGETAKRWPSFEGSIVTMGTLVYMVKKAGWTPPTDASDPLLALRSLSAVRRIDEMKKDLQNDRYIFSGMALAGQITLFYSKPNTGKTLLFMRLLIDAIEDGRVTAKDVFYINADDHFKGLVTKTEIAQEHGFEMISPAEAGVNPADIIAVLDSLAASGDAKGKVIILDTLKKFADMMNKASQSALYQTLRKLIAKDATVIIAGHANKYADDNGKLVYEGTADTMNDIDCAYSINLTSLPEGNVTIEFLREKNRGDNVYKANYSYEKKQGMSYVEMINSVKKIEAPTGMSLDVAGKLEKYESEILFISSVLGNEQVTQSGLLAALKKANKNELASEVSVRNLKKALIALEGVVWVSERGPNNAKRYSLTETSRQGGGVKP